MTAPLPASRSLRQAYESFIEQRVEEYKEGLSREELLGIGDEAVRELEREAGSTSQYLFTEVLIAANVNRLIAQRLRLPSYRRWVTKYLALRQAQLDPMHWGLSPHGHVASTVRELRDGHQVLVVGAALGGAALFVAAHDIPVTLIDNDLGGIEVAENRAVTEQLAMHFEAFVVSLGDWLPPCHPTLVLLDAQILRRLEVEKRAAFLTETRRLTAHAGTHIVLAGPSADRDVAALQAAAHRLYNEWERFAPPQGDTDLVEILVARSRNLVIE